MIRIGSLSVYVLLEVDVRWDDSDGLLNALEGCMRLKGTVRAFELKLMCAPAVR